MRLLGCTAGDRGDETRCATVDRSKRVCASWTTSITPGGANLPHLPHHIWQRGRHWLVPILFVHDAHADQAHDSPRAPDPISTSSVLCLCHPPSPLGAPAHVNDGRSKRSPHTIVANSATHGKRQAAEDPDPSRRRQFLLRRKCNNAPDALYCSTSRHPIKSLADFAVYFYHLIPPSILSIHLLPQLSHHALALHFSIRIQATASLHRDSNRDSLKLAGKQSAILIPLQPDLAYQALLSSPPAPADSRIEDSRDHKMPFCTYCGQSFTRDEHLERHILTRESSY